MIAARRFSLTIKTPEGIQFSLPLAGPVTRCLAWIIDMCAISALTGFVNKIIGGLVQFSPDVSGGLTIVAYFVISILYGISLEWIWRGQTVGKRLLRLRVVDGEGLRLQPSQVILRNLMRFVDMLPALYLVGGVTTLCNAYGQRLGDLAANTVVIRNEETPQPDLNQIAGDKFNSLLELPHLVARLRQRVTPEAAQIALQAVLRREQFDPAARAALFAELRDYFVALVPFPPELTEQITAEQYVRNVVQALFQRAAREVTV